MTDTGTPDGWHTAYIGLGSNVGDRAGLLSRATAALAATVDPTGRAAVRVETTSSLYETDPVGFLDQPRFLNAVAAIRTTLAPMELLRRLKAIEAELGRVATFRNGPRAVDLDLLLFDEGTVEAGGTLRVPHPRMEERAFVLVPLAEIAPAARHPVLGRTAAELLRDLGSTAGVDRVGPFPAWRERTPEPEETRRAAR